MEEMLEKWSFLVGHWKSDPTTQVGDPPESLNQMSIERFPSNKFLQLTNETIVKDKSSGFGRMYLFVDPLKEIWLVKAFYGFGFVINFVEKSHNSDSIVLDSKYIDANMAGFEGKKFRLTVTSTDQDEFEIFLNVGDNFSQMDIFWRAKYHRDEN